MKIIVNEGGISSLLSCFYLSFRKVNCVRKARLGIIRTLVSNECRRLRGAEFFSKESFENKCSLFSNNFIKLNWWNPIPFLIILNKDVFNELYEKYQLLIKFYQLLISEFFYLSSFFFFL